MINELILAWNNKEKKEWIPVGRLKKLVDSYLFQYTNGVKESFEEGGFKPFGQLENIYQSYEAETLFPLFKNRLLQKSRPEHDDFLHWINLDESNYSDFDELALTGGVRATDSLQLFPIPEKKENRYEALFFSHGIRLLTPHYIHRIEHLNEGNKLFLMKDFQNKKDINALAIRTDDPPEIVGYCPKFLVKSFDQLITLNGISNVHLSVVNVNLNAPTQLRLLCKISTKWHDEFKPFNDYDFQVISS